MLINDMPRYEILDEAAMQELERGWRRIVSELGIEFLHEDALEYFRRRGPGRRGRAREVRPRLDPRAGREGAGRSSTLQARNPERTRARSAATTWSSPPSTAARSCAKGSSGANATYDDFQNLVQLAQSFPQLDSPGGTICEPDDMPLDSRHLDMVYALLTLSRQAVHGLGHVRRRTRSTRSRWPRWSSASESLDETPGDHLADQRQLAAPLRRPHARRARRVREARARRRSSRRSCSWARCRRSRSPATLAQQVGEALAGIALVQTIRPGCPVVFGSFLSNTDMQSGSPSFGTPESAVGLLCTGQIARHYNLPFRGGGALTSSQVVDAQAGYESMMSLWPTFLAGTNFVMHSAGWLESALVSCYEKFVTDVERLRMLYDGVQAARDQRGDARVLGAPGGRAGRPLPRRRAHARALPRVLLPAARLVDRELRALEPERRQRHGRARERDLEEDARGVRGAADGRRTSKAELKAYVDRRRTELGD